MSSQWQAALASSSSSVATSSKHRLDDDYHNSNSDNTASHESHDQHNARLWRQWIESVYAAAQREQRQMASSSVQTATQDHYRYTGASGAEAWSPNTQLRRPTSERRPSFPLGTSRGVTDSSALGKASKAALSEPKFGINAAHRESNPTRLSPSSLPPSSSSSSSGFNGKDMRMGARLAMASSLNPQVPFPEVPRPPTRDQDSTTSPSPSLPSNDLLAILVPLLVLLSTLLLLLLLFLVMLIIVRRRARIALASGDGPLDVGREEELEGAGALDGVEDRWLDLQDEPTRRGYARAKDWLLSHPPASDASEITISQFLSIQEKGVSAWSFEPDYEANSSCYVEARTEITFVADGEGMAPQEGGGCCVQSNLPLPKINEVYYWEAKMFTKPETTNIALGLATKPYPSFRMPGWSKYSVGFFSQDGFKCHNHPFAAQSYGPAYVQGDVIGVGYRPRTGTVFFTRNGKRLDDAFIGLNRYNLFPTIGSDGPAEVHVNLGQAGFVFIEANVKKWGLAPMVGTLAPPPAYGQERGSILIEAAGQGTSSQADQSSRVASMFDQSIHGRRTPPPPPTPPGEESPYPSGRPNAYDNRSSSLAHTSSPAPSYRHSRRHRSARSHSQRNSGADQLRGGQQQSQQQQQDLLPGATDLRERSISSASSEGGLNPPTPGNLDISLHALNSSRGSSGSGSGTAGAASPRLGSADEGGPVEDLATALNSYFPPLQAARSAVPSSPPPYALRPSAANRSSTAGGAATVSPRSSVSGGGGVTPSPARNLSHTSSSSSSGSLGGTAEMGNQARRSSGRTHRLASTVFQQQGHARGSGEGMVTAEARDYEGRVGSTHAVSGSSSGAGAGAGPMPGDTYAHTVVNAGAAVVGRLRGWWVASGSATGSGSGSGSGSSAA